MILVVPFVIPVNPYVEIGRRSGNGEYEARVVWGYRVLWPLHSTFDDKLPGRSLF